MIDGSLLHLSLSLSLSLSSVSSVNPFDVDASAANLWQV